MIRWAAASVVACALMASGSTAALAAPPPNDNFANATVLPSSTNVTISGSNVDATNETGESTCCWMYDSVWYRWTAPKTGNYRLEVCGSSFDTHIQVSTGTSVSALGEVASNGDAAGCGPDGKRSSVTFVAGQGQEYRIRVGSQVDNQTGTISGSLKLVSPPNDFFADAADLGSGSTAGIAGTNVDASTEAGESLCCSTSATVWYRWTAPAAGSYRIETCASDFKTYLKVFTGTAVHALERVAENSGAAGCGPAGDRAAVTFTAGANTTYYFQIGSGADPRGTISGSIAPAGAASPPAQPLSPQVFPGALPPASRPPISGGGVTRKKGKYVLRVKGVIKLAPGVTQAQGCSGVVIITVKRGRTLITARTTKLTSRCTYAKTIRIARSKIRRARKLGLTIRFGGNAHMAATARHYKVRVRR